MKISLKVLPALTGLLSSSCCIIQLVLNFFSISCAGFAVLTPYRHVLSSITVLLLSYNMYNNGLKNRQALFSLLFSVAFMISPEVVKIVNHLPARINGSKGTVYYRFHLDGLGCEACANRIKNTLNQIDWIYDTRVFFDNQTAIVQTIAQKDIEQLVIEKIKSIDFKYDAQVLDSWVGYT
ncbi:uncharacterized protein EV154DRAFT_489413, partial [Mucor mucedo]|uniref:uncharacterized protein n=1 Tax=Mucor mucedo TaxID=29922 RepID=UPI00221F4DFE